MAEFNLKYKPRKQFVDFHNRNNRWACLVCHRRAGKTVAAIHELVIRALYTKKENARYAYLAPFYRQAKDIAWEYLKVATKDFAVEIRESELRIKLPNDAWITLYGADNPDALRGIYLDGVVLDEYGDCRPSLWGQVILPTLADRRGWAVFIGTFKGKNHFWDVQQRSAKSDDWYGMVLKASESGILSEEDIRELKAQMEPEEYAQEFECDPTAAIKGTYYADIIQKMEVGLNISEHVAKYTPGLPVYAAADLGYTDSTAFWFWQETKTGIKVIDYEEAQGKPLDFYIKMLNDKPFDIDILWVPHDARSKTLQTGRSTLEQLVHEGFNCAVVPSLKVQQGIDAARWILPQIQINSIQCYDGVEALRAYKREYDEVLKVFRPKPLHDWASDGADGFRYFALVAQLSYAGTSEDKPSQIPNKPKEYRLKDLFDDHEKSQTATIARRRI